LDRADAVAAGDWLPTEISIRTLRIVAPLLRGGTGTGTDPPRTPILSDPDARPGDGRPSMGGELAAELDALDGA
jgi:hypothetical protein